MKNRYFIPFLILITVIVLDQLSKSWAHDLSTLHFNQGFIMGYFSGQPASIRIVSLGFTAGILFTLFILLLFILPARSYLLKNGLSLMLGGILGNVIDKLTLGYTVDFIPFEFQDLSYVFNIADIFIWFGAIIVSWIVFRKEKLIWHESNARRGYILNLKEQFKTSFQLTLIIFSCCLLLGLFTYGFIRINILNEGVMTPFFIAYTSITGFLCLLTFLMGIILSHQNVGPVYAFELFVSDLIAGKDRPFKLRESDNFKQLEITAEKLRNHLKK